MTAGLAHDQLPRRCVDAPAALQRQHSVEPRRRHLAQGRGDRAERSQPVGGRGELFDRRRDPPRIGGFDPEHLEAAVEGPALAERRVQRTSVEPRPPTAGRAPLLGRPEVVHERERDIVHRVSVRDCDRQRIVRDSPFGVERTVDRVDDHADARIAEVDLAALLGHRDEVESLSMDPLELCQHERLGRAIDHERAVASFAARAGLHGTLGRGRCSGQHPLEA